MTNRILIVFLFLGLLFPRTSLAQDRDNRDPSLWAVDLGVAIISDDTTLGLFRNGPSTADGDAGGQIYEVTVTRTLWEFAWQVGEHAFNPRLEVPLTLGIVDENGRSPFGMGTAALMLRWVDFPWNSVLDTSLGVGGGLWYSEHVLAADRERHPDEDRSHLKFYLPIELTLALPQYASYQLVLFNHHASGGHLFDEGGIDVWGAALRYRF